MHGGVGHLRRHPLPLRDVQSYRVPCIPYDMQIPPRTCRCTGEHWGHMGVFEHMGVLGCTNVWQVYEHMGAYKCTGAYRHPPSVKHACLYGKAGKPI